MKLLINVGASILAPFSDRSAEYATPIGVALVWGSFGWVASSLVGG